LKIDQFDLHSQGLDGLVTVGVGGVVVGVVEVVLGKVTFGWVAVEVAVVVVAAVETLAFGWVQVVVESVTFGVVYVMGEEEEEVEKKKMVELLSPFYQHLVLDLHHLQFKIQVKGNARQKTRILTCTL
jgi:hypothetical protein